MSAHRLGYVQQSLLTRAAAKLQEPAGIHGANAGRGAAWHRLRRHRLPLGRNSFEALQPPPAPSPAAAKDRGQVICPWSPWDQQLLRGLARTAAAGRRDVGSAQTGLSFCRLRVPSCVQRGDQCSCPAAHRCSKARLRFSHFPSYLTSAFSSACPCFPCLTR